MTAGLPTTTTDITSEWLTGALRASSTIGPDAAVETVTIDPQAGGVGFMGEVGKLSLTYTDDAGSAPMSMIAKFATQSPEIKAMMHPTRVFEREHRFYEHVASESPVRTPDIYHVTCDVSDEPAAENYLLLMEDLGGLTLGD